MVPTCDATRLTTALSCWNWLPSRNSRYCGKTPRYCWIRGSVSRSSRISGCGISRQTTGRGSMTVAAGRCPSAVCAAAAGMSHPTIARRISQSLGVSILDRLVGQEPVARERGSIRTMIALMFARIDLCPRSSRRYHRWCPSGRLIRIAARGPSGLRRPDRLTPFPQPIPRSAANRFQQFASDTPNHRGRGWRGESVGWNPIVAMEWNTARVIGEYSDADSPERPDPARRSSRPDSTRSPPSADGLPFGFLRIHRISDLIRRIP